MSETTNSTLYTLRKDYGYSQELIADYCSISYRHYQNIEYGKTIPNVKIAQKIAKCLNVTVDVLWPLD